MDASRKRNATTAAAAIATLLLSLPVGSMACSPPLIHDYDIEVSMTTTPDLPGHFGVGATGTLSFVVDYRLPAHPQPVTFAIENRSPVPVDSTQPFRLTADPASECHFFEHVVFPTHCSSRPRH